MIRSWIAARMEVTDGKFSVSISVLPPPPPAHRVAFSTVPAHLYRDECQQQRDGEIGRQAANRLGLPVARGIGFSRFHSSPRRPLVSRRALLLRTLLALVAIIGGLGLFFGHLYHEPSLLVRPGDTSNDHAPSRRGAAATSPSWYELCPQREEWKNRGIS